MALCIQAGKAYHITLNIIKLQVLFEKLLPKSKDDNFSQTAL